MFISSIR